MEGGTGADSPTIKPISKSVVHRICSGQVIVDLCSAVKELVENSLDAGATSIEISLRNFGEEWIQVSDNGSGISPTNFEVLALKHHTSKLADFPDLQSLTTFGFRGEAISSLCALGALTVETRTKNEPIATNLTFDHSGVLVAEKKTARQIGTTVTVKKLFSNLPVRSKEFSRNIRKEYGKLISLLNAYAIMEKGVRFVCSNTTGKNVKSVVLKTQGSGSLKDNIITVLGMTTFNCLQPVNLCISEDIKVEGFLSKSGQGSGRNLGDRQFFFVNGRPVDMPKVSKLVNELYRGANSRQYPIAIMNFSLPSKACDVNVTPDKRKVFFADEIFILQALRKGLQQIYSPSNACYSVNKVDDSPKSEDHLDLCARQEKPSMLLGQFSPDGSNACSSANSVDNPTKDLDFSDLCTHREKSSMLLDQFSCNPKEVCTSENIAEVDVPLQTIENEEQHSDVRKGLIIDSEENTTRKDFTLRLHGLKKAEASLNGRRGKPTTNHNSMKSDSHASSSLNDHDSPSSLKAIKSGNLSSCIQSSLNKFVTVNKRKHETISRPLSEVPILRSHTLDSELNQNSSEKLVISLKSPVSSHHANESLERDGKEPSKYFRTDKTLDNIACPPPVSGGETGQEFGDKDKLLPPSEVVSGGTSGKALESFSEYTSLGSQSIPSSGLLLDSPKPSGDLKICSTLNFNFQDLKARRQQIQSKFQLRGYTCGKVKTKSCYAAATLELSQPDDEERKARALEAATRELERFFRKEDFSRMKVIGQFNLGFIIGKLDQDLFIVDQHAADEKYNFERLSESTILNQQPLLRPLRLELSPEEEVVASIHMDTIRKNGFNLEEDPLAPPGHHFKLKSVPFSKNITFGVEDVKDLISTLADSEGECSIKGSYKMDTPDSVCPSRVRAMLASRACRSSIMIGDPLRRNDMQKIVEHLAKLKSPWNCPHGRPTMRHLVDLATIHKQSDEENDRADLSTL